MRFGKTFLGGLLLSAIGIYNIVSGNANEGVQQLATGLSIIGIGHKFDKSSSK